MKRGVVLIGAGCLVLAFLLSVVCGAQTAADAPVTQQAFSYAGYAEVLAERVDAEGMVDYRGLKDDSRVLNEFIAAIGNLPPADFERWNDNEKIAFWLNAYNALTLKAIIDHYPIKASFGRSLVYPKNSIRQISGVWDKLKWNVMGRAMTLEDIEHGRLRKDFDEPRIHLALVCAARGCPLLRNEPYHGDRLDEQLDDQGAKFFGNEAKFRIDGDKKVLYISPIFEWFAEDFVETYGTDDSFVWYSKAQRALVNFASRYVSDEDGQFLGETRLTIKYLDYDWSLNEQQTGE